MVNQVVKYVLAHISCSVHILNVERNFCIDFFGFQNRNMVLASLFFSIALIFSRISLNDLFNGAVLALRFFLVQVHKCEITYCICRPSPLFGLRAQSWNTFVTLALSLFIDFDMFSPVYICWLYLFSDCKFEQRDKHKTIRLYYTLHTIPWW